jgi:hypothetical protein
MENSLWKNLWTYRKTEYMMVVVMVVMMMMLLDVHCLVIFSIREYVT